MVYYIALCNTTQYLYLCVFVCVCLYCLRVSLFLWVFECLCVFCLCVYLQRLTARDLSSSRRGQYPSHHPLCLFFSYLLFCFYCLDSSFFLAIISISMYRQTCFLYMTVQKKRFFSSNNSFDTSSASFGFLFLQTKILWFLW